MIRKIIMLLENVFSIICVIAILTMMTTIVIDSALRYFSNVQVTVAYTLSELYLMPMVIILGIAYTQREKGHTRVVFFYRYFKKELRLAFHYVYLILSLMIFLLITYQGFLLTKEAWEKNEIFTGFLSWPMDIAYSVVPIGAFLMVLRSLLDIYELIKNKNQLDDEDHVEESIL